MPTDQYLVFDKHPSFQVNAGKARRRLSSLRVVIMGGFHLAEFSHDNLWSISPPAAASLDDNCVTTSCTRSSTEFALVCATNKANTPFTDEASTCQHALVLPYYAQRFTRSQGGVYVCRFKDYSRRGRGGEQNSSRKTSVRWKPPLVTALSLDKRRRALPASTWKNGWLSNTTTMDDVDRHQQQPQLHQLQ